MEELIQKERLSRLLRRYRYPLAVLAVGLLLMLMPGRESAQTETTEAVTTETRQDLAQTLEQILSQIEGAGQVRVLLTERIGPEVVYQTDSESDSDEASNARSDTTVIVENADRDETPLAVKTIGPEYLGAIVVCQGADDPKVRLAVVEAVRCVTGLGADEISVQKMK